MSPQTATTSGNAPVLESSAPASPKARPHPVLYAAAGAYALLVALTIHFHEPWADEAQSWLLGRDASLADLWGRLLHYEGTPGLWQTLLHGLIRLGLPYSAYNFVSGLLGLVAVYLLLRYAPLPLFIRILLPFTYYLCYQYAVLARSYALMAPLLFALAVTYRQARLKLALPTVLLALLAGVSVHGFLISACIWVSLYSPGVLRWNRLQAPERWKLGIAGLSYWFVLGFFMVCAWPAKDVAFAEHRGLGNLRYFFGVAENTFAGAFAGYWLLSLALIALSVPFLWRGGGWLFFLLASGTLCLFGTIVYSQAWHLGTLFLAWLFAIWISAYKTRVTWPTIAALTAVIGFQCYWTARAVQYDWSHAYSGSLEAAEYLRQNSEPGSPPGGLYAIGYSSTALQPYFSANIFSNFHDGARPAYWDWSKQNTANDPSALFASSRRDQVLVGFTEPWNEKRWCDLLELLGYQAVRHFGGDTFWQTGVFEHESFDLYRKVSNPEASSSINMGDPAHAAQLLNGFYNIEAGKWRWTARIFTVLLKAPPGSGQNGAQLSLTIYIPDAQLHRLGPMTLYPDAGGHALPARTFTQGGEYTYSAAVPAEALRPGLLLVNFQFDRAAANLSNGDQRELSAVVTAVGLNPAR
jgi:hypothetical protein